MNTVNKKVFLICVLGLLMAGCSTTETTSASMQTQMRVMVLEKQLRDKDQEVQELKYQISDLSGEMQRLRSAVQRPAVVPVVQEKTAVPASEKDEGIIRVPVSVQDVQAALKNAGCYEDAVDGKPGLKTRAAIEKFQRAEHLTVDGIVGQQTWNSLKEHLKAPSD